ncbi:DUF3293 domain-containing protein [Deinococcus yavapaiensis]|uniref:Uncharacterized protein DUF3293 n=1 Tax=Deinococcus yavapaiensis KR-236 TaxID=694435 RepID=A0A318SPI6_9DEIO|nr:DUF3293 domain-containing protein [Deinococcus yavapaiensis]PYE54743.1 uncharacterized protein DUF3293 [Deinococcus yavapaiensis KR-236]
MNEDLWRAFEQATYGTREERFALSDAPSGRPSWANGTWGIVTAWNPSGERTPERLNEWRQGELRRGVEALGRSPLDGVNGEGEWEEASLIVVGASLREVRTLGARFDQAAVVWGVGRRVAVVACGDVGVRRAWV